MCICFRLYPQSPLYHCGVNLRGQRGLLSSQILLFGAIKRLLSLSFLLPHEDPYRIPTSIPLPQTDNFTWVRVALVSGGRSYIAGQSDFLHFPSAPGVIQEIWFFFPPLLPVCFIFAQGLIWLWMLPANPADGENETLTCIIYCGGKKVWQLTLYSAPEQSRCLTDGKSGSGKHNESLNSETTCGTGKEKHSLKRRKAE